MAGFGFRGRRIDRAVWECLGILQAGWHGDPVYGLRFGVFAPGGAGDVPSHNSFDREDLQAADLHGAVLEERSL